MKAYWMMGSAMVFGVACAGPEADSQLVEWDGAAAPLVLSDYQQEDGKVTARGTIDGEEFSLYHERGEVSNHLTIEHGETKFTFERGAYGQNKYSLEQPDRAALNVDGQELNTSRRKASLAALQQMRTSPDASQPRADLEERGVGLWLAMLPEVIEQLGEMGLEQRETDALAETTTGTYMMLMAAESQTLWAGGVIGRCNAGAGNAACNCPAVTCFAGSTPTGISQCTVFVRCIKASGEVVVGPLGEVNGEFKSCTEFGQCTCAATCQQCGKANPKPAPTETPETPTEPSGTTGGD